MIDLVLDTNRLDPRADLFQEFTAFVLPPETPPNGDASGTQCNPEGSYIPLCALLALFFRGSRD